MAAHTCPNEGGHERKRGEAARYPFFTIIPVLMVNELFDAVYHHARDIFDQLRGNLENFWNQVRLNLFQHVHVYGLVYSPVRLCFSAVQVHL